jgi:hypothetical protein
MSHIIVATNTSLVGNAGHETSKQDIVGEISKQNILNFEREITVKNPNDDTLRIIVKKVDSPEHKEPKESRLPIFILVITILLLGYFILYK